MASTPCDGSCAERCRQPDTHKGSSGGKQGSGIATTALPLAARRGSSFPGSTRRAESPVARESCGWIAARAHLCRLVSAADAAAPVVHGTERAASRAGGYRSSTCRAVWRNPRLLSLLAGLLCLDPDERLTPAQALAHPFFGEVLPFAIPFTAEAGRQKVELAPTAPSLVNRLDSRVAITPTRKTPQYVGEGGRREQDSQWGSTLMPDDLSTNRQELSRLPDSNGANDDVLKAQAAHPRQNGCPTVDLPATARSWVPSCPEIVSATGTPSSLTSACGPYSRGAVETPSQLLRLTDMASEMVRKCDPHTSGGRDGGRDDTAGRASLPTTITPGEGVQRVRARCEPSASAQSGASAQERGENQPKTTPAAASARLNGGFTVPGQIRRPNRFLTPSTLAKLNRDLRGKGKDTATTGSGGRHSAEKVLAVGAGETTPSSSVQTPPKRGLAAATSSSLDDDQKCPPKKSTRRATEQKTQGMLRTSDSFHEQEPAVRTRPKRRVSSAYEQARVGDGQVSRAVVVGRTTTPRRRAAVAAVTALSLMAEEEEDAESDHVL